MTTMIIECRSCGDRHETEVWVPGITDKCARCGRPLYREDEGKRFKKDCPFCCFRIPIEAIECPDCQEALDEDRLRLAAMPYLDSLFQPKNSEENVWNSGKMVKRFLGEDGDALFLAFLFLAKQPEPPDLLVLYFKKYASTCPNIRRWLEERYSLQYDPERAGPTQVMSIDS